MSRTFDRKHHDESTLTTLCPRCLNAFRNARGIRVRRADQGALHLLPDQLRLRLLHPAHQPEIHLHEERPVR